MKLKNVKVGMDVLVKKDAVQFEHFTRGRVGKVLGVDHHSYADLAVMVDFGDVKGWGSHYELKLVKEGVV